MFSSRCACCVFCFRLKSNKDSAAFVQLLAGVCVFARPAAVSFGSLGVEICFHVKVNIYVSKPLNAQFSWLLRAPRGMHLCALHLY